MDRIVADDIAHVFHSWSAQADRDPVAIVHAEGCRMWDSQGNDYLDFGSQLVNANLGHQHPRVVAAIKAQADRLCTIAPFFANDRRGELARRISELAPGDLKRVFFTNGGAEAVENAARLARLHTGRLKVLSAYRSYHGATTGAITLTGDSRRWPNEPGAPGVVHFFGPYLYRSAFGATTDEEECQRALHHLDEVISLEGPGSVAAVLLETVVGTNGILVPPDGYLAGVRRICDAHGAVMICDEVMAGFGRTGATFAVEHWNVTPDLIAFAKGVNSGYVPLGGVVISERIAETFAHRSFPGGLTYSGHPLACASAIATLDVYRDDGIDARVRRIGDEVIRPGLHQIAARHASVGDVRGLGMFWAIELVRNRETRTPLVPFGAKGAASEPMDRIAAECKRRGLWPLMQANRIHVVPPLVISEDDLRAGLTLLDEVLTVADAWTTED